MARIKNKLIAPTEAKEKKSSMFRISTLSDGNVYKYFRFISDEWRNMKFCPFISSFMNNSMNLDFVHFRAYSEFIFIMNLV